MRSLTYDGHRQAGPGWGVVAGSALGLHLGPGGSHLPRPLQVQVSGRAGSEAGSGCCMQISTGRKPLLRRLPMGSESTAEKSLYFLKQKPPSFTRESQQPIRRRPDFTTQIRNCEECPGLGVTVRCLRRCLGRLKLSVQVS